ncbi:MAG TPA: glycosyltransferase family 2 protein [Candidatus Elarobacter sp.]
MTPEPITIAVPFVDGLPYLRETLESARALTGAGWNVVVADNTREAAVREAARTMVGELNDGRFRFRAFGEHVPICASFNRAMGCATTDLVTLLHADDRISPSYVAEIRALADAYPAASAYYCGATIIDARGRDAFSFVDFVKRFLVRGRGDVVVLRGEAGVTALSRGNFIMGPTVCFRLSQLGEQRWPEDLYQAADLEYWTRILFAGGTIVGTKRRAYEYRRHAGQSTAQVNRTLFRFREEAAVFDLIAARAAERGWSGAARIARLKLTTRLQLAFEAANDVRRMRLRDALHKVAFLPALGGDGKLFRGAKPR